MAAPEDQRVGEEVLRLAGIAKNYGHTAALRDASITVRRGEIVGLIGHNGAGKSTLMRVIVGLTHPDRGEVTINGRRVGDDYSMRRARELGVRIAHQELSLAPELKVFENVLVAAPAVRGWGWRRRARALVRETCDQVFAEHRISLGQPVRSLSLAQQQMVEISLAALESGDEFALLILDEPTSALGAEQAEHLFRFIRKLAERGISTILISHKLHEILGNTDRVLVMRDGRIVSEQRTSELDHDRIVALMGGVARAQTQRRSEPARSTRSELLAARNIEDAWLHEVSLSVREGEIVGLAGLDGQGQQQLLRYLWRNRRGGRSVRCAGGMSFVTGDRQTAGVFPLWDLSRNIVVGALGDVSRHGVLQAPRTRGLVDEWMSRLAVRGTSTTPITELSGGNQQKALIARALASRSRLVLLDDPFRGVDIETKQQVYRLMREEAEKGRGFLWFTTENAELEECDRVYVMAGGRITAELGAGDISEEAVIGASFQRG
jgi:ribose transport system ATP-binding protein